MAEGKKGKKKGKSFSQKGGKLTSLGRPDILPKNTELTCRVSSSDVLRSVRVKSVQLEVDHIMLLVSVLISACCVDKWYIVLQNAPTKGKPTAFSPGKRAFGTYAQGFAVFDSQCYGATVEEIEQDQDEEDIEDFVAFSIKSLEGFVTLDGEVTKTVSGFMSVQPVTDRYEDITIETTDVGFTFAGGETEAANTKICIPHAEFPQGI